MELATGVHAFPQTLDRGDRTATYHPAAVETGNGVLLLDVGFPGQLDRIAEHLEGISRDLDDVRGVVLTHQDGDHVSGLHEVVERTEATVFAHELAAPYVDGRMDPIKGGDDRYPPVPVDVEIVDGVTFRTVAGPMRVVFTPGHAPGHVSLYVPDERLLIAADALTAGDGTLQGPSEAYTLDMDEAVSSLDRLADLDVERTLCYHGGFVEEGSDRIRAVADSLG